MPNIFAKEIILGAINKSSTEVQSAFSNEVHGRVKTEIDSKSKDIGIKVLQNAEKLPAATED